MRFWSGWVSMVLMILALGVTGCGKDAFGPPARSRPSTTDLPQEKTQTIYFVMTGPPVGELEEWAREGQIEANMNHTVFPIVGPRKEETTSVQPDIIRKAIADGASGLIVIPGDSPELGKVLADAEASGVAVVLVGRSIPAPEGSKPFTVIEHEPFEPLAKRIVATTLEDNKKALRPAPTSVMLVTDQTTNRTSAARVASLKDALAASGISKVVEVAVDGKNFDLAKKQVLDAVNANPEIVVIFGDDDDSLRAASSVHVDLIGKRPILIGGYVNYGLNGIPVLPTGISCYYQGRYEKLVALGVKTILSRLKGEPVSEKIRLSGVYHHLEQLDPNGSNLKSRGVVDSLPKVPRDVENFPTTDGKPASKP